MIMQDRRSTTLDDSSADKRLGAGATRQPHQGSHSSTKRSSRRLTDAADSPAW